MNGYQPALGHCPDTVAASQPLCLTENIGSIMTIVACGVNIVLQRFMALFDLEQQTT
jgi:hypothetical protein